MFTKEDMKNVSIEKAKASDEKFNKLMDNVPLRVIDAKPELDYYTNPTPSMSDHISFLQHIINTSRIVMKSSRIMKIAEALFKQGFLFRHQPKAIEHKATRYSRTEEKMKEEMEAYGSCDHTSCEH